MEQFDIAICGYGPVGSTFAGLMGKLGHKVLVIEKNIGPSPTARAINCLLYTSPSPRDRIRSRMPASA